MSLLGEILRKRHASENLAARSHFLHKNSLEIRALICIRQMNESFTSRSFIYPKTRSGGEQLVHLPDRSLTRRHGREVNDSFICRIQIFGSMFRSSANRVFGSMIRSSAGYGSLDHFSRDLHRLSTGS